MTNAVKQFGRRSVANDANDAEPGGQGPVS
jgi:hypothetical protein